MSMAGWPSTATVGIDKNDQNFQLYSVGFPLGKIVQEKDSRLHMLNNHYDIIIDYHTSVDITRLGDIQHTTGTRRQI